MPLSWRERWSDRDTYIDKDGSWKYDGYGPLPLDKRVEQIRKKAADNFTPSERTLFVSMLESMLKFRPDQRATADEVLESRWMQECGLPSLEKDDMNGN